MTYKQAYNKIIEAYFKDEIKPLCKKFCFCGNLSGHGLWANSFYHKEKKQDYTLFEYGRMEEALFKCLPFVTWLHAGCCRTDVPGFDLGITTEAYAEEIPDYEDHLFAGMTAALEVLKEIHRERGEDVDEVPALTKRSLTPEGIKLK